MVHAGDQLRVHRDRPLHQRQRDRAELVVLRHGADAADGAPVPEHRVARSRQLLVARVQVQQHHPARRPAQVRHPRDRLLPAVAALGQVHGRRDPADLVRDRAVVRVEVQPRRQCLHPQRLERHRPGRARAGRGEPGEPGVLVGAGNEEVRGVRAGPRHPADQPTARQGARSRRRRPSPEEAARRPGPARRACPGRRRSARPARPWRHAVPPWTRTASSRGSRAAPERRRAPCRATPCRRRARRRRGAAPARSRRGPAPPCRPRPAAR